MRSTKRDNLSENRSFRVGQLAAAAGLTAEAIRFYERSGLLPKPQRTAAGYRLYPLDALHRLQFICRAKQLGFALEQVKALLDLQDHGGTHA